MTIESDMEEILEQARLGLKEQLMTTEEYNLHITQGKDSKEQTQNAGGKDSAELSDQSETESTKPRPVPPMVPKGMLRTGIGRRYR